MVTPPEPVAEPVTAPVEAREPAALEGPPAAVAVAEIADTAAEIVLAAPVDDTPVPPADEIPVPAADETPAGGTPVDKAPADKAPVGETSAEAGRPAIGAGVVPAGDRTPERPKAVTHREMPAVASPRDAAARSAAARAATARRRPSRVADDETALLQALFHPAPAELTTALIRIPEPRAGTDPIAAPVSHRRPRPPRPLSVALPTLVVLAFAAAFFAWMSAMPIWLAVGHGRAGTATVTACPLHGIPRSCATFVAADRSYTAWVTLLGPGTERTVTGQAVAAEMPSTTSSVAYAGPRADLYPRLGAGLGALLACGAAIVWATGALRLGGRRARMIALAGSFGGPLLLLLGMLTATF